MSGEESLERDIGVDKAYQMPQLTWGTEGTMHDDSNSRVEGGEDELECPLPLEPHLQELLSGEETFPASTGAEDSFPQTLMPDDPMKNAEWIQGHT